MKTLNTYIVEKFQVGKDYKRQYTYQPKNRTELRNAIQEKIDKEGLGTKDDPLDLNDIDTSKITDMSWIFSVDNTSKDIGDLSDNGYFDISDWDVSNVRYMRYMFNKSHFNGDISDWDVSNVEDMSFMFADSSFNGNISDWDVKNVKDMHAMFFSSTFNGNIDKWNVKNGINMTNMFLLNPMEKNPPKWYHE